MTTINVVLGTPHIEVDPVTSVVTITLAGPQGPQGEPGSGGGGGGEWGDITGTLSDQTDLQDALDDKQDAGAAAGGVLAGTYPNPTFAADMATQAELNAVAAAAVNDGDSAGGVLSGTYPNPTFAVDMATQAELNAVSSVADAAIAPGDSAGGDLTGTYPNPTFAVNMATQAELDAHISDATDAHAATAIANTPAGSIAATTVQAAINELDTEKQPLDADLTTLATAFVSASASGPATLAFNEDTDNGSNKITISAPASVGSDAVVTLPGAAGLLVLGTGGSVGNAAGLWIGTAAEYAGLSPAATTVYIVTP